MSHDHHHHHDQQSKNIGVAFWLNFLFALAELVGGFLTNSVSIFADALHDLGDSLALALSWLLQKKSNKKSDDKFSFGYLRFSLLGAFLTGAILVVGSVFVLQEAVARLLNPQPVHAYGMAIFAVAGVSINLLAVLRLRTGSSLNEKMVTWHLLEDLFGWIAVGVVSVVLMFTNWYILDPILSIVITLYIFWHVWGNLKKTISVFLQAIPDSVSLEQLQAAILQVDGVLDAHHIHLWSMDGEKNIFSCHIAVDEENSLHQNEQIKKDIRENIHNKYSIFCSTIEIENAKEHCPQPQQTAL